MFLTRKMINQQTVLFNYSLQKQENATQNDP